ncbi:MAG: hypothetical protein K2L67_04030 [Clostridia bacterium]|nr:hypothetical protein [Clostridia bacterium]
MDNKEENVSEKEEKVNIRHTITAEETFTLAKDVFDIRCFIKNVYANRAVIARRLNIISLLISFVFTALYTAFVLFTSVTRKLEFKTEITLYVFLGVYAVLFIAMIIAAVCSARANTKSVHRAKLTFKVFKLLVRIASIIISIAALVLSAVGGALSAQNIGLNIVVTTFSIIMLVLQVIPLLFGGAGKLVRWLLSPVKIKYRFSTVVVEWYTLAVSGNPTGSVKKVSSKYFDDIGALIDVKLIPALGKKYITAIKPVQLINLVNRTSEADRAITEGVLKSVFSYATECGYVTFDPCRDLNFEGSVEEEEKPPKPTMKGRLLNIGKKIGKSMLDKYIESESKSEADGKNKK